MGWKDYEVAVALELLAVMICKCSVTIITDPNSMYIHSSHVTSGVRGGARKYEGLLGP